MENGSKFSTVKDKLISCLNEENKAKGVNRVITAEDLRLWKTNFSYNTRDKLADFIKEQKIGGPETKFVDQNNDVDIEENTGVSFPGSQLETYLDKTYNEAEKAGMSISSYFDLVVVEQRAQD